MNAATADQGPDEQELARTAQAWRDAAQAARVYQNAIRDIQAKGKLAAQEITDER